MNPFTVRWLMVGAIGLSLAIGLARAEMPTPEDIKREAAQEAILKLSENLGAQGMADRAKKIVKEHESEFISSVFKLKTRGGLGIGKLTKLGYVDGIERFINLQGRRRTTSEADLENYYDEYLRVAKIFQTMAELAPYRASEHVANNEGRAKAWAKISGEFKALAGEFRQAVDEKDPKKVRLAALNLSHTCCECHGFN